MVTLRSAPKPRVTNEQSKPMQAILFISIFSRLPANILESGLENLLVNIPQERLRYFLSCCIHYTRRGLAMHLTPRRAVLRRATQTARCFDTVSRSRRIGSGCAIGLSETAWMIGCPEEPRSRSFASRAEHGKGVKHRVLGSGWRVGEEGDE